MVRTPGYKNSMTVRAERPYKKNAYRELEKSRGPYEKGPTKEKGGKPGARKGRRETVMRKVSFPSASRFS